MIKHYFTVAFRNLWKYKSQTLISVISLAVGFTCFALATLWIRYETTFDTFHKNADRIYCVTMPSNINSNHITRETYYPLAGYLKELFPEISKSTSINFDPNTSIEINDVQYEIPTLKLRIDSSFLDFFDIKILEGSKDFLIYEHSKIAITQEKARQLFGNESPIGKVVKLEKEFTVCAVVIGLKHSNYTFDFLSAHRTDYEWYERQYGEHCLVKLSFNINDEGFKKKLYEDKFVKGGYTYTKINLVPLTEIYYKDQEMIRDVKFQHIIIFAGCGLLLILCTLFNYLTLFISRFNIRQREMALRTVYGASGRSLFALLSVEFIVSMLLALVAGLFFIDMMFPAFKKVSAVNMELSSIYIESLIYIGVMIVVSLLTFLLVLSIFRRRTLSSAIRRNNNKLFRKTSVIVQLMISIIFAFCTIVIVKQMYHLHNTDLGFAFKNRGSLYFGERGVSFDTNRANLEMMSNKLKQIPEITETFRGCTPLINNNIPNAAFTDWDDKSGNIEKVIVEYMRIQAGYAEYYEFRLIEGELLSENDGMEYVLINESAAKEFGWQNPVGKSFSNYKVKYIVKGVIKNVYRQAPTIPAKPCLFFRDRSQTQLYILFKYNGEWKTCADKIKQIMEKEYPAPQFNHYLSNLEENYDLLLKSENTLLKLLTILSLVCIIICVFGFVSLVSLTCEERRKEIAIRKINGATIKDILDIFFKEYIALLVVGAVIAFPAGYLIMKRWLEEYVVQTPINAWVYAVILLALIMSIILCVGWKVYKTSTENPAEVVKS